MGPAGQGFAAGVQGEVQAHRRAFAVDAEKFPVALANQAVGRADRAAFVHALHLGRVAPQVAEPGPADRHATAHRRALPIAGLAAQPDHRLLAMGLIAQDLSALLGHQQFGVAGVYPPADQFIHHQLFHGGQGFVVHRSLRLLCFRVAGAPSAVSNQHGRRGKGFHGIRPSVGWQVAVP
jgi:hypothetical protein